MKNNFIESLRMYVEKTDKKEVLKQWNKCKNIGVNVEDFLKISKDYDGI